MTPAHVVRVMAAMILIANPKTRNNQPAANQDQCRLDWKRSQQARPATAAPSIAASGWTARP